MRAGMKAYMSDIDGGPVFLDQENPLGSVFDMPAKEYAAKWAENEARAILAETEQGNAVESIIAKDSRNYGAFVRLGSDYMQTEREALAEALEAFVNA
jgi:hypothetical protein